MHTPARLLIVEDYLLTALDLNHTVRQLGYEVVDMVESGEMAIQKVCDDPPDLVLMDINLAGEMDGIRAAEQIRSRYDIPIIYLSAYSNTELFERAKLTLPFGYVLKPFEPQSLHRTIEISLYKHRLDQELKALNQRLEQEIIEHSRTENALRKSEELHRTILSNIGNAVFLTNDAGKFTYICPNVEGMFGYSMEEMMRFGSAQAFFQTCLFDPQELEASGEIRDIECQVTDASGHSHILSVTMKRVSIEEGTILYTCYDITRQKRMEEQLRHSERELQLTLEATTDGVWTWNFSTDALFFSPTYYTMLGYEPDEFPASFDSWIAHIHPDDREAALHTAKEWLQSRPLLYKNEFRMRAKTGDYRWIRAHGKVVERDTKGNPTRMIGTHEDITERRQAEEELKRHKSALQRLSAQLITTQEVERRKLSQELHDELGQALTAIRINLATLEHALPPDQRLAMKTCFEETSEMVEETLERVRQIALDLRPSMLDDLGLLPALRWYIQQCACRLHLSIDFQAPNMEGQRLQPEVALTLYRAVQEALTNVAKHAQARNVNIRLEHQAHSIHASIEDNGRGFQTSVSEAISSAGIGLLGMRERITMLAGTLQIHSAPEQGTRLEIDIPVSSSFMEKEIDDSSVIS